MFEPPEFDSEVTLETISQIPWGALGIYALYGDDNSLLYIGKSNCLRTRISAHLRGKTNTSKYKQKVSTAKYFTEDREMMRFIYEEILIKRFTPPLNINLNKKNFKGETKEDNK